jgi:dolichol-phosphate mannosyltransferase
MPNKLTKMKPIISLILPIYNEEGNIDELYKRSKKVLSDVGSYEIIFINDFSRDNSLQKLIGLSQKDKNVKIIDFSRNFGHQIAITAGIDYAEGDAIVIMDADLQDTPETIVKMVNKWKKGYDVVYGKRRKRKDTMFKKFTAFAFYRLLRRFANIEIPEDTGDFRLMDRKVVKEMKKLKEHSRFMRGLTSWVGFKQTAVLFDRDERRWGATNYPFKKMLKLSFDALTSFSNIPLRLASYLGFFSALVGFAWGLYAVYRKLFLPSSETVPGWTTIVIAIFFIGGIQLIILGIIGEYIGRIYTESQNRPLYIINKKINFNKNENIDN